MDTETKAVYPDNSSSLIRYYNQNDEEQQRREEEKGKINESDEEQRRENKKINENNEEQGRSEDVGPVIRFGKPHYSSKKQKRVNQIQSNDESSDAIEIDVGDLKPRRKKINTKWSNEEIDAVIRHLNKYIKMKRNPGKAVLQKQLLKKRTCAP
uniref:Uncharacterized protein n=1 Tax=Bombyx mori TaxID=7091 RepID=A0A8R2M321_BOMMO|nr:uncharacterized protein LOC119629514 [Bombyx mori]